MNHHHAAVIRRALLAIFFVSLAAAAASVVLYQDLRALALPVSALLARVFLAAFFPIFRGH